MYCISFSISLDFRNKYGTTEERKNADKIVRLQKRPIPKIKWNALAITGALMRVIVFFCHVSPTARACAEVHRHVLWRMY